MDVGSLTDEPPRRSPPGAVTMFVYNRVSHDSRVLKSAATLAAAGWRVTVIGRQAAIDPPAAVREQGDGFLIVRVPVPRGIQEFLSFVRRPWGVRGRVVPAARRSVAALPSGWMRLAGMAGGALLAAPWTAYRLADRYAFGDRGPTLGRGGAADWWLRWHFAVRRWGRRAASEAPPSDVWHGHDLMGLEAALAAQELHGGQVVYDSHDIFLETTYTSGLPRLVRWRLTRAERRGVARAVAVIAVSEPSRAELERRYHPRRSLVVVNAPPRWHGGDGRDRLRGAIGLPPDAPVALYHGGMSAQRGMETLAASLLQPRMAGVHAVFLGYGQMRSALDAWAADPRYGGRLHVLDAVPPEELLDWIATADVGVCLFLPSSLNQRLTLPNKLFEALAAGVPVIASDFPQYRAVLLDDPGRPLGAVVDPADPAALAHAVRASLDAPASERAAQRRRCRDAAREQWNWETQTRPMLDLYADLVRSPERRA